MDTQNTESIRNRAKRNELLNTSVVNFTESRSVKVVLLFFPTSSLNEISENPIENTQRRNRIM